MPRGRAWRLGVGVLAAGVLVIAAVALLSGGQGHGTSASSPAPSRTSPPGTPVPPAPGGAPVLGPERFGASVNRLFNAQDVSRATIDFQLARLAATGATIARSDALWEAAEPVAPVAGVHHYDWAFADEIAGSLAAHGLQWLPIIDYSAPWAQSVPGVDHSPPASAADYAAYAGAFAARYGPGGAFWTAHPALQARPVDTYEIWNEPDNPVFWKPTPDPARFAALYLAARAAIRAADPAARVIVGGLTAVSPFVPGMLAARPEVRSALDGVGIHLYGASPAVLLGRLAQARAALTAAGLGSTPLYVTEFGWSTHPPGDPFYAPARLRPGFIDRTLSVLGHTDCRIAAAVLYTWVTPMQDVRDREDWFGISPPSGTGPDVAAFTAGLHAATAPGARVDLCAGSGG
jgi:hypothetical protein